MSKGSKRRSYKQIERDFKHAFTYPAPPKQEAVASVSVRRAPLSAHEKAQLHRAAEKERLRAIVRAVLAAEEASDAS